MGKRRAVITVAAVAVVLLAALLLSVRQDRSPEATPAAGPSDASTTSSDGQPEAGEAESPDTTSEPAAIAGGRVGELLPGQIFGNDVPQSLVDEIMRMDRWESPAMQAARQRIISQGEPAIPQVLAALEDVVQALGRYDPDNIGADRDAYQSLMMKQNHLMGVMAMLGNESHAEALIAIGRQMHPHNMLSATLYESLDRMGASGQADTAAAIVIAAPESRGMQLVAAMARYWLQTPADMAGDVEQHLDTDIPIARAMAFQLAVNAGLGQVVHDRLVAEVASLEYANDGNRQMLIALARTEEPRVFLPRMDALRLKPSVVRAATTFSRFTWADIPQRETMLPDMLGTSDPELQAAAIQFMLENDRGDLLQQYGLVYPQRNPHAMLLKMMPGFAAMTREQKLQYMTPEELEDYEKYSSEPPIVSMTLAQASSKTVSLPGMTK